MKQYKLIKTYPNSPELGTVISLKNGAFIYWVEETGFLEPEKYPEHWQVVEKDYEILSLVHKDNSNNILSDIGNIVSWERGCRFMYIIHSVKRLSDNQIFSIGDKLDSGVNELSINSIFLGLNKKLNISTVEIVGSISLENAVKLTKDKDYEILKVSYNNKVYDRFDGTYWFDEKAINIKNDIANRVHIIGLKSSQVNIHSVKRLSDGFVFTVEDKVDSTISDLGRVTELTGFKFFDNKLKVGLRELGYYPLSTIILPKTPLFKTHDNVDIYEGDKYWYYNSITKKFNFNYGLAGLKSLDFLHIIRFSTETAMNEYIAEKEVLFVTKNGNKLRHGDKYYYVNGFWSILEYTADKNKSWEYQYQFKDKIFSTKKAAQEFILKNQPLLSYNDVNSILGCRDIRDIKSDLLELIKSKNKK